MTMKVKEDESEIDSRSGMVDDGQNRGGFLPMSRKEVVYILRT